MRHVAWPQWEREFYREAGALIRAARLRKNWLQAKLAEAIGLKRSSIVNIEAGRQKMLLHTFFDIEDALGAPRLSLFPSNAAPALMLRDVIDVRSGAFRKAKP